MQLVAYGAQDIYLTGNPQITFFKVVYRRHTNFSMECIQQTIQGASTTAGGSGTVTVSRNGDLVYKVYVTSSTAGIERGDALVSQVDLEIGGQLIDRQYSEWHRIWDELTTPESKADMFRIMKCNVTTTGDSSGDNGTHHGVGLVQIPLKFWFCRNPGLALPLIALQYHEVKLKFTWGTKVKVKPTAAAGLEATCQVWADYIYLDTDERRRFAQVSHEYLIEQLQKDTFTTGAGDKKLNFNHPVKELIWVTQSVNAYGTAKLTLNGHDRFAAQEEEYFQLRQPYDYHTAVPRNNTPSHSAQFFASQAISKNYLKHTNGKGIETTAMTTGDLTLVTVAGSADPLTAAPAAGAAIADARGEFSCFLVGALDAQSGINAGTLAPDFGVIIEFTDASTGTSHTFSRHISRIVLSTLAAVNEIAEVRNDLGPLHHSSGFASVADSIDETTLTAAGAANQLTNQTGGALLVSLDQKITLPDDVQSGQDLIRISIPPNDDIVDADLGATGVSARTSQMRKKINVYSFALKPEEHQPSGTCNFSRIDSAKLNFSSDPVTAGNIYAVNYNVLRIMSGMGGLAYSN